MVSTRAFRFFHVFAILIIATVLSSAAENSKPLFKQSVVDLLNNMNPGWVAGYTERVHKLSPADYKVLLGTYLDSGDKNLAAFPGIKKHKHPKVKDLPKSFDARDRWPHCKTIDEIRDQGHCGSCWAFGAVEVLSDRFCIHLNESVSLSTNDLVSCCGFMCGDGCNGGWPYKAWRYFIKRGVVSAECQPYFDPEGCPHPGCSPVYPTPKCEKQCSSNSSSVWAGSKHFSQNAYVVGPKQTEIMAELFLNGPMEVDFTVFEDFVYYKSGVYKHVFGGVEGGHAVKLVGWGTTDDGIDFWTIANSWSRSWGEDGYFRIVRGVNECGIEADAVAGIPSTKGRALTVSVA